MEAVLISQQVSFFLFLPSLVGMLIILSVLHICVCSYFGLHPSSSSPSMVRMEGVQAPKEEWLL
jgi:hypothetical protein